MLFPQDERGWACGNHCGSLVDQGPHPPCANAAAGAVDISEYEQLLGFLLWKRTHG